MMRICKIYDGDYPWDVRVEKIVSSLVERGHEVHLVCRNLSKQARDEFLGKIYIHRLPALRHDRLNSLLSFPAFFNPVWIKRIYNVIKEYQIELVIVRDLPMALTAIMVARFYKIPVVLDMAENYPGMLRHIWKYGKFKPLNLFVRNPLAAKIVERISVKHVDHIFAVIEEARERLKKLGVPEERISILMNTPRISRVSEVYEELRRERNHQSRSYFTAIYVGGIGPGRGLDQVVQAVPGILKKIPIFRFLIIGSQGGSTDELKAMVNRLGLTDHVIFMGWIEPRDIPAYINQSDVGIIPHCISEHTLTTIPNKLFDYMAFGKPVVASNVLPIRKILEKEKCGLIFNSCGELIEAIVQLFSSQEARERLGANGRNAVLSKYNWERSENILIDVVEKRVNFGDHFVR